MLTHEEHSGGPVYDYNFGWFGLIVLALDAWAIVKIVRGHGTAAAKITWIVVILLLPVLGLVLRALLGPAIHKPKMYEKEPP